MKNFLVRLTNWEYWPFSVIYFPVSFYYIWLAIKCRSFFFFTAANPRIDFGGMLGEKKSEIFDLIPNKFIPETKLIPHGNLEEAKRFVKRLGFPVIAKPDIGERGIGVKKMDSEEELIKYVSSCPVNFLMQQQITYPIELGVFFIKYPGDKIGKVTSIMRKNFLTVVGDGTATIMELLTNNVRAQLTANLKSDYLRKIGKSVPAEGEEVLIESIGNHCRGTQFLNDNHHIDKELNKAINSLAAQIPDFYFGRFDLKCQSYNDLKQLKNVKILELNGAGAEPGHIYQPGYSLLQAYKDIFWHLRTLADISLLNHKKGVPYWSFLKGYQKWKNHLRYNRLLSS